jgi:putative transposase
LDSVRMSHLALELDLRHPGSVPRTTRVERPGELQHVIARGNGGGRIVAGDDDRRAFVTGLARVAERYGWRVHAYCLMDTHVHLVVETPEPNLGAGMQRLLGGYAYGFNRRHRRFGHLFAGRFGAVLVETEAHAVQVSAYVVLNPVRAALVAAPEDWPWSSYRASAGLVNPPPFLETRVVPAMFHVDRRRAQEAYRQLVREISERPTPGSG